LITELLFLTHESFTKDTENNREAQLTKILECINSNDSNAIMLGMHLLILKIFKIAIINCQRTATKFTIFGLERKVLGVFMAYFGGLILV
jgi:hypothetical protein